MCHLSQQASQYRLLKTASDVFAYNLKRKSAEGDSFTHSISKIVDASLDAPQLYWKKTIKHCQSGKSAFYMLLTSLTAKRPLNVRCGTAWNCSFAQVGTRVKQLISSCGPAMGTINLPFCERNVFCNCPLALKGSSRLWHFKTRLLIVIGLVDLRIPEPKKMKCNPQLLPKINCRININLVNAFHNGWKYCLSMIGATAF